MRFPQALICTTILTLATLTAQERPIFQAEAVTHLVDLSSPGFEAKPDISHDRLTLFYASDQAGGVGGLDLWAATRPDLDSSFGLQTNLTVLNSAGRDHTPTTSADGLFMLFSSNRPGGLGTDDAWMSNRQAVTDPWGEPVNIPELSSASRDMGFTMTPDGLNVYFTSNRSQHGDFEIYSSSRPDLASNWAAPTPVYILNTPWEDKFPSVTGDNLTMYFASNRPGGVKTMQGTPSLDLWVAMRSSSNQDWQVIENLFEINTEYAEYLCSISDDGEEFFFVSDRPGSLGILDLFQVNSIPGIRRYGTGVSGELGVPRLRPIGGIPVIGNASWGYEMTNVSPYALGVLLVGLGRATQPFLIDIATPIFAIFQRPIFSNPPGDEPRILAAGIPNDPAIIGFSANLQAIMFWDLKGQRLFASIPYAATPGLEIVIR